jgi:uncharacterized membrane protein YkoI
MTKQRLAVIGTVLGVGATFLHAADKKVQMKDLPPAVQKAVQERTKGATLVGLATEKEGGKTVYEVETKVNGKTRDMLLDATGRLIEVEDEVAIDSVPPVVKAALEGRGTVLKVESVTRGTTVTYEAEVEKNGRKSEIALGADGKSLKK